MAKILMIDDDERMLKLYSSYLEIDGHKVTSLKNGKNGLEIAIQEVPDLILLDVMMPSVDGAEVSKSLSEHPKTKHIPVIFLTALVREEEVEAHHGVIGGQKYISKATPRDKFVAKVKEILAGK
jgi:CheY-like chemotaxis protein